MPPVRAPRSHVQLHDGGRELECHQIGTVTRCVRSDAATEFGLRFQGLIPRRAEMVYDSEDVGTVRVRAVRCSLKKNDEERSKLQIMR